MPVTKKHSRGTHTLAKQKVDRMELEGSLEANGDGGMVNCAGRGEHASAREIHTQVHGTHAPAHAMLVNDQAMALGRRGPVLTMGWRV